MPDNIERPWPNADQLKRHLEAGHDLIPLHRHDAVINRRPRGKSPRDADWTRRTYDARTVIEEALRDGNNVGVRLGDRDLVVDVDPRNFPLIDPDGSADGPRRDAFAELCATLGLDPANWPRVATGGGGLHYYLRKPEDVRALDSLSAFPGVEFKSRGRQVLAAGSVHPSGRHYMLDFIDDGIADPPSAPAALIDAIRRPAASSGSADAGELTPDKMAKWLDQLDPEEFRDHGRWLELMMSCHHATAGEGRQEFIDWSTGDPPYADHESVIGRRWDSLHTDRPGSITAKTLYKRVYEAGGAEPIAPPEEDFEPWDGEEEPTSEMPSELDELCRRWVWVADANAFVDRVSGRSYNNAQFEGLYCHLVPPKTTIVRQALKGILPMLKLQTLSYRPGMGELPDDGTLNLWRPSDVVPEPGDVSWFLDHMAHLVPNERERGILFDLLAHLVQHPGEKINYAPIVQGGQGTGKSALGILMERILGENNVARPSNSELKENFTGWLRGKALVVVEELMAGGSRDLANKLKPLITDPRVSIREMYRPGYTMANTVNFLMFTNHREAIPVEADDRRYFVIFSPAQPKEPAYYERLFGEILGKGAAHVAHWLRGRDLSDFDPKGRAPATAAKQEMRLGTMGEAEAQLIELRDSGHPALAGDLANVEELVALLDPSVRNRTPRPGHAVAKFLREEMGAVQLGRSRLAGGTMRVLWALKDHEKWKSETPAARGRAYDAQQNEDWTGEG